MQPQRGTIRPKYFLALLPHFCSAPACSQLPPGRDLPSLPRFSHPMERRSQSPFPVVTAHLFPSPPDSPSAAFTPPGSGRGWWGQNVPRSCSWLCRDGLRCFSPKEFLCQNLRRISPSLCKLHLSLCLKARPHLGWFYPSSRHPPLLSCHANLLRRVFRHPFQLTVFKIMGTFPFLLPMKMFLPPLLFFNCSLLDFHQLYLIISLYVILNGSVLPTTPCLHRRL